MNYAELKDLDTSIRNLKLRCDYPESIYICDILTDIITHLLDERLTTEQEVYLQNEKEDN